MAKPILLFKPIFEDTAQEIVSQLLTSDKDVVDIWMNTPGGAISAGWSILATLNELNKEADITVLGDADSFGFFMLLFARKTKAFDSSSFTVHRAASFWEDLMTDDELKVIEGRNSIIRAKMDARLNEDKFKEVTGFSFDDIFTMEDRLDVTLDAKQAKEIGLIDEVVTLNTSKREEIESNYINQIAALSQSKNTNSNINKKSKSMGIIKAIFGEKDSILLGKIGEIQFAYSGLEKGIKVRPIGEGDLPSINGTFEASNKTATIVNDEITAITEIDTKQAQIDALTEKLTAMALNIAEINKKPEVEPIVEVKDDEQMVALTEQVDAMAKIIAEAKLSTSNPALPKGEFKQEPIKAGVTAYDVKKEIEARANAKQAERNIKIKGGN